MRANRIRRVTKYSIGVQARAGRPRRPRSGGRASIGNDIEHTGQLGIFVGGVADALFEDNRIAAHRQPEPPAEGRASNDTFGVSCNGAGERIVFRRNRIEDMAGMAISWGCKGRGNVVAQTRIVRSCRQKNPESCTPGVRTCYYQPDVLVAPGATGDLALVDTAIEDSGCASPLAASPSVPGFDLVVRGGRYAAGSASILPVQLQSVDVVVERGASFTGTALDFGPGTRGVVAPTVSVTGKRRAFRVDPGSQVLVCPDHRSDCEKRCAAPKPPRWCSESGP